VTLNPFARSALPHCNPNSVATATNSGSTAFVAFLAISHLFVKERPDKPVGAFGRSALFAVHGVNYTLIDENVKHYFAKPYKPIRFRGGILKRAMANFDAFVNRPCCVETVAAGNWCRDPTGAAAPRWH
jgi:hypothetical protein